MNKLFTYALLLLINSTKIVAQTPVTTDLLEATFKIRVDSMTGTGFIIGNPDSNLMVTARHIFKEKYTNLDTITYFVYGGDKWESYNGIILLHSDKRVDIAIIKPDSIGKWPTPYNSKLPSMFLGEDALFLGFPYDIIPSRNMAEDTIHYPFPIIKKAMYSGYVESDSILFYLFEGHNNSGFSGGPIITKTWKQNPIPMYNRVVAVVMGFYPGLLNLETSKGTMVFPENSGVMIGVPAFYISDILEQNGYFNYW